jgi:hypothetical protein
MPASVPSEELSVAVMTRLSDLPAPVAESRHRRLLRRASETIGRHRRRAVVAVTAIMLALLVTPPVRAAVADWFGFAGVSVRIDPTPAPSVASPPPALGSTLSLDQARDLVAFEPLIPAELGQPQGVQVAADHRLLSMSWTDKSAGPVRLDQFDGQLDFVFAKTAPGVEFTEVNGDFAIWFDQPHEVVVLNADGTRRTETARLAGHTLIWEYGGSALRLEGDLPLSRAIEIADSVAPVR